MSELLDGTPVRLKAGVAEDLYALAVEIVDALDVDDRMHREADSVSVIERILIERIGARVKGRAREPHEMTEEEQVRFDELVGWASVRATVRLRAGVLATIVGVKPNGKAKVWYNAAHHTVPWSVIVGRVMT